MSVKSGDLLVALADLGGVPGARPLTGPNSFIFACIFTENHLHRRSTAPLMGPHPLWEILDLPLYWTLKKMYFHCLLMMFCVI